jgi:hypothetical protein
MQSPFPYIAFGIVIFAILLVLALVVARQRSMLSLNDSRRPQGFWMGVGMNVGLVFGVAFGFAIDLFTKGANSFTAIGTSAGLALGVAVGAVLERKHKDELRPLTDAEKKLQRWGILIGLISVTVLVAYFMVILVLHSAR